MTCRQQAGVAFVDTLPHRDCHTAFVTGVILWIEEADLSTKCVYPCVEPGNACRPAQAVQLVSGGDVVETSQNDIELFDETSANLSRHICDERSRHNRGVEFANALCCNDCVPLLQATQDSSMLRFQELQRLRQAHAILTSVSETTPAPLHGG
jgi:hypothetical protein